ncbi:sensor histidine kinase [Nakamurella silvestris]|nr:sensor histidine kinase [Nakamurella silvestris]
MTGSELWTAGYELPPYSLWRRTREWEPRGRWLHDRPQVEWPDTLFSVTRMPWLLRLLLIVSFVLGQLTIDGGTARRLLFTGLVVTLWAWIEWWQHWDLAPLGRRLIAVGVQISLMAGIIAISPLGGLVAWTQYVICGTFFTGPVLIAALSASCLLLTTVQVGGFGHLDDRWALTGGLFALNALIGLSSIGLANRREEAVLRRNATAGRLLAEQRRNSELHQQLLDQARAAGIGEERARLAQDLHDTVAQGLVAVITQLEAIDDDRLTDAETRRRVDNAKTLARQGLGEARRAVHALRPIALVRATLPNAINQLLDTWSDVNNVEATVIISGDPRPTPADPALIRVAQESLANVARHARARHVAVNLDYLEDQVLLDIHDDGVGFDPTCTAGPSEHGGHGLPGMADRLRSVGGTLAVESEPGGGSVISAGVPG